MKKMMSKLFTTKTLAILLIVIFILSLIPMLYISKYTFLSEDDFSYGRSTMNIFEETGSFFEVVKMAFNNANSSYKSWQGTYSGIVVMSLGPYVYGLEYYFLTTYILLFLMILSTLFFTYKLFKKYLGLSIWNWIIIAILVLLAQIQFMQHPNSSFYWYNGSSLYMTFYCTGLLVYGLLIDLLMSKSKKRLILYALIVPLAAFTATGNFVISLNFVIINFLIVFIMMIFKNKNWKKAAPVFIIALAGLLFIALAPGNAVRIEKQNQDATAIEAIVKSFSTAFLYIFKPHFLSEGKFFGALIVLLGLPIAYKLIKETNFKFRYPALVVLISFCIFASVMTPTIWGLGNVKLPRVNNIVYFYYIWMVILNSVYIIGWAYRKLKNKSQEVGLELCLLQFKRSYYLALTFALMFIITDIDIHDSTQLPTTIRTVQVIRHKTGHQFALENEKRIEMLESDEKDIVLSPYTVEPDLLYYNDMGDNPDDWFNRVVANYFDKDSVVVK